MFAWYLRFRIPPACQTNLLNFQPCSALQLAWRELCLHSRDMAHAGISVGASTEAALRPLAGLDRSRRGSFCGVPPRSLGRVMLGTPGGAAAKRAFARVSDGSPSLPEVRSFAPADWP